MSAHMLIGDVRAALDALPDGCVDAVVTSPPFLALRSYLPTDHPDKAAEIGSERTPAEWLNTMLDLTEQWARVLAPHGSIAVEIGDTYAGSGGAGGDYNADGLRDGQAKFDGSGRRIRETRRESFVINEVTPAPARRNTTTGWPLPKSLCVIPALYTASLAHGWNMLNPNRTTERWRIRNIIRWVRPNPPVGALGDKARPATSEITVACKSTKRWFDLDACRVPMKEHSLTYWEAGSHPEKGWNESRVDGGARDGIRPPHPAGAPLLDWWNIPPGGYSGCHYAVFPPKLVERLIDLMVPRRVCRTCGAPSRREVDVAYVDAAGRPAEGVNWSSGIGEGKGAHSFNTTMRTATTTTTGWSTCGCPGTDGTRLDGYHTGTGWRPGIVLDPFVGSGTTLNVANNRGRDAIGIDLDQRNTALALERCDAGLFGPGLTVGTLTDPLPEWLTDWLTADG